MSFRIDKTSVPAKTSLLDLRQRICYTQYRSSSRSAPQHRVALCQYLVEHVHYIRCHGSPRGRPCTLAGEVSQQGGTSHYQ